MKISFLILSLLLLVPKAQATSTLDRPSIHEAPTQLDPLNQVSMHDSRSYVAAIDHYIQAFNESKKGDPRFLSQEISQRNNGGTYLLQLLEKIGLAPSWILSSDGEGFNDILWYLMFRYYNEPQSREAIFQLIQSIQTRVSSEIELRENLSPTYDVFDMTVTMAILVAVWDWRRGAKGIKEDFSDASAAVKEMIQKLRNLATPQKGGLPATIPGKSGPPSTTGAARTAPHSVDEPKSLVPAKTRAVVPTGKTGPSDPSNQPGFTLNWNELKKKCTELFPKKPRGRMIKTKQNSIWLSRALCSHLVQLYQGALFAAPITATEHLYLESDPIKLDPMSLLIKFQAYAINDLTLDVSSLEARTDALSRKDPRALSASLTELEAVHQEIKKQYDHLRSSVPPELLANFPWPELAREADALRTKYWHQKLGRRNRIAEAILASQEAERAIRAIEDRFRHEAEAAGYNEKDAMVVDLLTVGLSLESIDTVLKAYRSTTSQGAS